jgi:hypothetical protein
MKGAQARFGRPQIQTFAARRYVIRYVVSSRMEGRNMSELQQLAEHSASRPPDLQIPKAEVDSASQLIQSTPRFTDRSLHLSI